MHPKGKMPLEVHFLWAKQEENSEKLKSVNTFIDKLKKYNNLPKIKKNEPGRIPNSFKCNSIFNFF